MLPALQHIIVMTETYKFQTGNIIVCGVNEYMPSVKFIFIHKSTYKIQMKKYNRWNADPFSKIIQNDPVTSALYFLLDSETIAPKVPNISMLLPKI